MEDEERANFNALLRARIAPMHQIQIVDLFDSEGNIGILQDLMGYDSHVQAINDVLQWLPE